MKNGKRLQKPVIAASQMTHTQICWRLMKEAIPPRWKLYVLSLICMVGVAGFTGALAYSTKLIVNDVFVAEDASAAIGVALLVMAVSVGKSLFQYANAVISTMFNRSISANYQKTIFRRFVHKDVWHFFGKHAATQMAQVRLFGMACGKVVVNLSNKFLTDALTIVGLVSVMIWQDPVMSLIGLILFPVIFLLVTNLSKRVRAVANAESEMTGALHSIGTEAFEGIKTVKSYGLEQKSVDKFNGAVNALEDRLLGIARVTSATVPVMELLGGLVIGLFVIYAAWQTMTYGKTPGEFTAFITAFLMAYQPAERVSKVWVDTQKSLVHVQRMYNVLEKPPRRPRSGSKALDDVDSSIEFDSVSFEYEREIPALNEVSFKIPPGSRVAIVGRSGAGKTTLIDLIQRFYDPVEGVVRIGGRDLTEVSDDALRDSVALISQDVFLFEGSIRDNIRDGRPEASDLEIEQAAQRAALDEVTEGMPNGIDTEVGPNGSNLSGGQKQRVGIARALAKHAKVYIFDEATSALDAQNERKIMDAVIADTRGSTMLFVTHRPSTLEYVDLVLLLDKGRLVAFDTHDILSTGNKRYQTLFNLALSGDNRTGSSASELKEPDDFDDYEEDSLPE